MLFADDCETFSPIFNQDSVDRLQNDLDRLHLAMVPDLAVAF